MESLPPVTQGKSKTLTILLVTILALIVVLGVFELGIKVGYSKGRFGCGWGDRFGSMLGLPSSSRGPMPPPPGVLDGSGAVGSVLSVQDGELLLKTDNGVEKSISILPTTELRKGPKTVTVQDLNEHDHVIVIGHPNDQGQIEATFIRVFDHRLMK